MSNIIVKKIKGRELDVKTKEEIDEVWKKAYKEPPKFMAIRGDAEYADNIFFLVLENNRIMAVGNLKPVDIVFSGVSFRIFGIADIASRTERRGYGKILMKEMLAYIKDNNISAVGFSEKKNRDFYLKCGFKVATDLKGRFVYFSKEGEGKKNSAEILYYEGRDKLISNLAKSRKNKVELKVPFW